MIVVLSACRPRLEDHLTKRGEEIIAIIPESIREARESAHPGYPIRTVEHFDDYTTLAGLAVELEALGVTAVATIDEPCVRAAAFLRGLLDVPGQDHNSAVACTDKWMMKRRLSAAGIPVAEHRLVRNAWQIRAFLDETAADIVVKPRYGFATINTHRVSRDNVEQLASAGAFDPPAGLPEWIHATSLVADIGRVGCLAERFVDVVGEYHCELLRHEDAEVHCLAARYFTPVLSNHAYGSVFLDPDSDEAIRVCELTRAAASALGLTHGFGHCEILRDRDGRWLLGEFAARPGGLLIPRTLQLTYGVDNLDLLADQLVGRRPRTVAAPRGAFAWATIPVTGSGIITGMPDEKDVLNLPGVIEAQIVLRNGDSTGDLHAALTHAAYVVCRGEDPEQAETLARQVQHRCRIDVEQQPLVEQALSHRLGDRGGAIADAELLV
ncbi:hypothetical protein H7H78_03450 [Mycobacterium shinjukuense]|uniref:Uncharacterized protein n=1 Tax=Mycobacterium shinjukuense TaxID=398694 RepID=A0A7I7MYE3_9MYCO|nr:hypothetical protein [Mycobacterium shinjukuense]MCV6984529.1 hypothetical protein [Mycobacterium shinjukuense]ORB65925.1 hypothetical protein BST45_14465 [Mycobacterium shinjukuense]BBX76169.1 hypothetical protein MSHI_40750 [Mycobacterium shinjukuense]